MLEDIKSYFANFDGATNSCRTIALWVSIALIVAFVVSKVFIAVSSARAGSDKENIAAATKLVNGGWILTAIIAAGAMIVAFSACYFTDVASGEDTLVPVLFYPLLAAVLAALGSAIALFVKPIKLTKAICAGVCGAAVIAVIVCMSVYYASGDAAENNGTDVLSNIGLYISAAVIAVAIVAAAFVFDKNSTPLDTRTVTFGAVSVALSFALSYVRIFKMPMGGSITLASMLPLMLFAFMFGAKKGILVGLVYGILQAVQDPWIIHPAQFVLDYVMAFMAIGLTGILRSCGALKGKMRAQFAAGACIAVGVRFVCHYFAGVFAFGVYGAFYAAEYEISALANEYFYSFVYQCIYLLPELAITLTAGLLVMSSKNFRYQINKYSCSAPSINADAPQDERVSTDGVSEGEESPLAADGKADAGDGEKSASI